MMSHPTALARRVNRLIRLAVLACCAGACSTWSSRYDVVPKPIYGSELSSARITLKDGRKLTVYHAQVQQDSLVGQIWRAGFEPITVPLQDVTGVQVRQIATGRTLLLVGGILYVIGYAFATSFGGGT